MPYSVDEAKFMAELERLMDGVPARREFAALRKRAESLSWGGGSDDSVSLGGVALVRFMSKGRRGMGRRRGGPSSAMMKIMCVFPSSPSSCFAVS